MWRHSRVCWLHRQFASWDHPHQPHWRYRWLGTRLGRGTKVRTRIDCQSQWLCIFGCRKVYFASKRGSRIMCFEAFSKTSLNFRAFHRLQGFWNLQIEPNFLNCRSEMSLRLEHSSKLKSHRWVKGISLRCASSRTSLKLYYLYSQFFYYACCYYLMYSKFISIDLNKIAADP